MNHTVLQQQQTGVPVCVHAPALVHPTDCTCLCCTHDITQIKPQAPELDPENEEFCVFTRTTSGVRGHGGAATPWSSSQVSAGSTQNRQAGSMSI